jgi:hypothetical protein
MSIFSNHVTETLIFSPQECEKLAAKVRSLRTFWKDRNGFFTLGASSYLDKSAYQAEIKLKNPLLIEQFSLAFFDDFRRRLKQASGEEFRYLDGISYPGFHIFPSDFSRHAFHFDLNYEYVAWPEPAKLDFSKQGSLTVALEIPSVGAGLFSWPDWDRSALAPEKAEFYFKNSSLVDGELRPTTPPEETHYQKGHMYSFGPIMHRVWPRNQSPRIELRITLQAHSIWHRDGYWILYW